MMDENRTVAGCKSKIRHMSMQDRVDMYNRDLEENSKVEPEEEKVRRTSRVMFDPPRVESNEDVVTVGETPSTEAEVHQVPQQGNKPASTRTRKVSKVSMFEFVPEEN